MKTTLVLLREPRARTVPGWRGGPAIYARQILTVIYPGPKSPRFWLGADNDNKTVAA